VKPVGQVFQPAREKLLKLLKFDERDAPKKLMKKKYQRIPAALPGHIAPQKCGAPFVAKATH
jgi:hypothetical protein